MTHYLQLTESANQLNEAKSPNRVEKQQKQPERDGLSVQTPYKKQFVSLIVSCPSKSSHAYLTDNPHVSMTTAAIRLHADIVTNTH